MGRPLRIIVTVVTGLLLTGCLSSEPKVAEIQQVTAEQRAEMQATESAGGGAAGGGGPATWVAVDIDYSEAPDEVTAGEVEVELVNEGAILHNVVIEELNDETILEAEGGEADSGTVQLEPDTYTYYCDVAGHRAAGMEGTLTVVE